MNMQAGVQIHKPGGGRDRGGPKPAWTTLERAGRSEILKPHFDSFHAHLILHLFSGERREGDLQWQIEQMRGDKAIWVMSLDICNGALGDMSKPETVAFWLRQIVSGRVIGVAGGPPCETWSAARFWAITDAKGATVRGPRPLRLRGQPWGLRTLTEEERKQVDIGNALLRCMLSFLYMCAATDIPGLMEHPAPATWQPRAASSFQLPEVRALLKHPKADLVTLDQCRFGQHARKPTCLLTVGMPGIRARRDDVQQGQVQP